jgi:Domain of unknown function (DUF222)
MFDRGQAVIPDNLDQLEPGLILAAMLASIDGDRLSGHQRITVLRARQRMISRLQADQYRDMAAVVDDVAVEDGPEWAEQAAAAEIQAALRLTRRASQAELSFALELQRRLPMVWDSLAAGDIDYRRAKTFSYRTAHLSVAAARSVVERVIDHGPMLTTGQLKARIDRLAMEYDSESAKGRYDYAVTQRRVVPEATADGTANLLGLDLAPQLVSAASRRIDKMARSLKTTDETRTMDQLRADVFLDLLTGANGDGTAGTVHIQTDLDTLTALASHPGELNGYGPVVADIARQVTEQLDDAEWRFTVDDTATGELVADGVTRRRPSSVLRRRVETRNPTCVFPGCRMPSVDCDLDHTRRWADGGQTTQHNQAPLCRYNHIIKDQLGWRYRKLSNGDYEWTSRLGHTYTASGRSP